MKHGNLKWSLCQIRGKTEIFRDIPVEDEAGLSIILLLQGHIRI